MPYHVQISVHSSAPTAAVAVIDAGLDTFNTAGAPLHDVRPLHAIATDEAGGTVGGAIGRTWGQCCELQQLWVSDAARRHGVGTGLMKSFEAEARRRGCTLIYLDTFSFQAPDFYRSLGFKEVLRIAGFTGGVVKHTLHKSLDG